MTESYFLRRVSVVPRRFGLSLLTPPAQVLPLAGDMTPKQESWILRRHVSPRPSRYVVRWDPFLPPGRELDGADPTPANDRPLYPSVPPKKYQGDITLASFYEGWVEEPAVGDGPVLLYVREVPSGREGLLEWAADEEEREALSAGVAVDLCFWHEWNATELAWIPRHYLSIPPRSMSVEEKLELATFLQEIDGPGDEPEEEP